jgi:hypothetical protein
MACIDRRPRCGIPDEPVVPEPLSQIGTAIGSLIGILGALGTALGLAGKLSVSGGVLSIGGVAIGPAAAGGALSGLVAGVLVIVTVGLFAIDRCTQGRGLAECLAGVVAEVVESFSSGWDEVFPFSAMHDRVDVVVKSRFWDVVEDGGAFVYCTDEAPPRRSEILRCYYYDSRVCEAAEGALIGAGVGAAAGVIAAALVAAAIGCATVILCIVALIVAALVAAAVALTGALIGGQVGKAAATDDRPTAADGAVLGVGDLVSVRGSMKRREHDSGANVFYWTSSTSLHGRARDGLPIPFSYCEIDEELATDSCEVAPSPIE